MFQDCLYAPAIYNWGGGGGHIASALSVRPVHTSCPVLKKNGLGGYLLNTLVYWIHISYTGT